MANPRNPLDFFTTYTYHFELHIAPTWEEIVNISAEYDPRGEHTTATQCNGSLVISTIKDAHQSIDNVRYKYDTPMVNELGHAAAISQLTLTVTEPGGCSFFEKIKRKYHEMDIEFHASAYWLLKIFFVGRYDDNSIETTKPLSIPLVVRNMGAKFDHRGGEYDMVFWPAWEAMSSNTPTNPLTYAMGYSNKDIHLSATTIQEAFEQLQIKLNENYEYYVESLETRARRKVRYVIEWDPKIQGNININNSDSFAPGEKKKLSFSMKEPIIQMMQKIVNSSTEMNQRVAESKNSLRQEFYPNIFYPTYDVFYRLTEDEVIITYKVNVLEGKSGPDSGIDFEFDYLFSEPAGKNVDVINFELKFDNMFSWMDNYFANSTTTQTAHDPKVPRAEPGLFSKNTHVENRTMQREAREAPETSTVDQMLRSNDVIPGPGAPLISDQGFVRYEYDAISTAKLAFDSWAEVASAHNGQQTFSIRGHYLLLDRVSNIGFAEPLPGKTYMSWVKVNIKDKEGNPFFYTGWYLLEGIENVFQNGQFIQNISAKMMPREVFENADSMGYDSGMIWE